MTDQPTAARARWTSIFGTAWLVFVSVVALSDHGALSHYKKSTSQAETTRSEVSALKNRVTGMESAVSALKQQPAPITHGQLDAARTEVEARLSALEERLSSAVSQEDLAAAKARLTTVEERQLRVPQTSSLPPSRHRSADPLTSTPADPPFNVLGIDWRGGERFLALAPRDASTSGQVLLLRAGDRLTDMPGDWELLSLEDKVAIFVSQGRQQRISIP